MQIRGKERAVALKGPMRLGLGRRLIGWIAAYALVLHAVFAGMVIAQRAPAASAASFEICVSHPDGVPASAPGQHQHDQCALHCAAVAGLAPLVLALIALAFPLRQFAYPRRRRFHSPSTFLCRAGLSRAPPLTA